MFNLIFTINKKNLKLTQLKLKYYCTFKLVYLILSFSFLYDTGPNFTNKKPGRFSESLRCLQNNF